MTISVENCFPRSSGSVITTTVTGLFERIVEPNSNNDYDDNDFSTKTPVTNILLNDRQNGRKE